LNATVESAEDSELPGFFRAAEFALRKLPPASPLRALVYEQFLDFVSNHMPRERPLVGLALLGSSDQETSAIGESLMSRPIGDSNSGPKNSQELAHTEGVQVVSTLDLLVLTPKGPELSAAMAAFGLSGRPSTRLGEDSDLWLWNQNDLSLGLAVIGTDGNVEAAIELNRIAASIRVRAAALVGMAAGLEGEVSKGDIVIASWVVAYEFARVTKGTYVDRAKPYQADMRSVQKVSQAIASYPDWGVSLAAEIRACNQFKGIERGESEKLTKRWRPKIKTGVVFAGSRLIEDGSLRKLKEQINDRGLAAEMEGAGFAAACSALRIPWLVVRGIADYGDQDVSLGADGNEVKRGKSWQFPSTYVAAAYIRDMVITGRIPLVENARSRPS
jgi:nucleoside phosphorylase